MEEQHNEMATAKKASQCHPKWLVGSLDSGCVLSIAVAVVAVFNVGASPVDCKLLQLYKKKMIMKRFV